MSVGKSGGYQDHESKAGTKKGAAQGAVKKEFGCNTDYAPKSKTHIATGGKKK